MTEYLITAEADKIQDLIFRSSKLKEIIGGSELLRNFCNSTVPILIGEFNGQEIASGGGTIFATFPTENYANQFRELLAELYRQELNSTLTMIKPTNFNQDALKRAHYLLKKQKLSGNPPTSVIQTPFFEVCSSCGVGIASKQVRLEGETIMLCNSCYEKNKMGGEAIGNFLGKFKEVLNRRGTLNENPFIIDIDEFSEKTDKNGYIAYLLADGNDMGAVFHACDTVEKVKTLSSTLENIIYESLAIPTTLLMDNQDFNDFIPILPLIIGGDDLFSVIPAAWVLDFTRRFIRQYEKKMGSVFEEIQIDQSITPPNLSASVVICKSTFPYRIAHQIGEELLNTAKKISKSNGDSAISFMLISGSLSSNIEKDREEMFVMNYPAFSITQISNLIEDRYELRSFSQTKRIRLKKLYEKAKNLNFQEMESSWYEKLSRFLTRLPREIATKLENSLRKFGDPNRAGYWERIEDKYYNGVTQLIDVWNFCCDLEKSPNEYITG
ncbi:MAG: hypothetical protein GF311_10540 [Candidatus Lokiarchaeota archaeon]|nr:hypothetical protein [Candidatus Lokiarchaeota archaeon]